MQLTLPDKTPNEHEYVPPAVWSYPVLHVGVHDEPLARLDRHVPREPSVGAVTAHALGLHTAESVVSMPAAHVLVPDAVYPLLHVGVHELPLARLAVHGPASPFVGAADASHALALHTAVSVVSVPNRQVLVPDTVYLDQQKSETICLILRATAYCMHCSWASISEFEIHL